MKETQNSLFRVARRFTILPALLLIPSVAFAQNCALCYTQAAGSGSRIIQALRSGILILVIPPMVICLGLAWMTYQKRNQFNEE
jgi:ABC-type Fe3+ transport system permease subunit